MAESNTPGNNVFNLGDLKTKELIAGSGNHITLKNTEQKPALPKVDLSQVKPSKSSHTFNTNNVEADKIILGAGNTVEVEFKSSKTVGNEGQQQRQRDWENDLQE
uniref:uncharacterized protein LOC120341130 n=1 Tax=Styela clava TaxID=7725 RepID=UPI00193A9DF6|nr:uncharacterized protein LOC120341130 [Styela clava]